MLNVRLALMAACIAGPVSATTLIDGGFEAKGGALPVSTYCYDNGCGVSPWVNFAGLTGIIKSGAAAFGSVIAAEGSYYGFVQSDGTLAQSFTATASGNATVTWVDTNRAGYFGTTYGGLQSYNVSVFDGVSSLAIGSFGADIGPWVARTSSVFALTGGTTYSLRFTGLSQVDSTVLIDNVSLATEAIPEPASWALMIAGFGLIGAAMRRRCIAIA